MIVFYDRVKALVSKNTPFTLRAFIESLGINYDSYNGQKRYNNLPRVDEAVKIAKALNTTVEYLVNENAAECTAIHTTAETKANTNDLVNHNLTQKMDLQQEFEIFYKDMFYTLLNVMAHKDIIKQEWKRNRRNTEDPELLF